MKTAKKKSHAYIWHSQQQPADCEVIECPEHDPYKNFKRDPSGYYILVRIEWDILRIAVAICDKDHKIKKIFKGRNSQDLYCAILDYERRRHAQWFQEKTHIAYLGKELKKAEIAMAIGVKDYFQE